MRVRTRIHLSVWTAFALAVSGFALAACGSSSSSSPNAAASPASAHTQALRYSDCMRSHGVPNFPDPQSGGGLLLRAGPGTGLDPRSPSFQSAEQACRALSPNGGTPPPLSASRKSAMLEYSRCMRSHGEPNFPDPSFSGGGVRIRVGGSSGINPASPAFKAAQTACGSLLQKLSRGPGIGG